MIVPYIIEAYRLKKLLIYFHSAFIASWIYKGILEMPLALPGSWAHMDASTQGATGRTARWLQRSGFSGFFFGGQLQKTQFPSVYFLISHTARCSSIVQTTA